MVFVVKYTQYFLNIHIRWTCNSRISRNHKWCRSILDCTGVTGWSVRKWRLLRGNGNSPNFAKKMLTRSESWYNSFLFPRLFHFNWNCTALKTRFLIIDLSKVYFFSILHKLYSGIILFFVRCWEIRIKWFASDVHIQVDGISRRNLVIVRSDRSVNWSFGFKLLNLSACVRPL